MEIVVKHTITLDPAVIELLKGFSGGQPAPVKEMTSSPGTKGSKAASQKTEVPKDSPAPVTTPEASGAKEGEEISFTDIRQLYLQKKEEGKQDKVKKILDEYGVSKLSEFKPDQFTEVYNKIKAA